MTNSNTNNFNKGFTLVETLIAISILLLAVTGAYSAAQTGISSAVYSKDQIVAFYLAQEGVEQIRNVRDQNGLSGNNWLAGIAETVSDPCYFGKVCKVDAVNIDPVTFRNITECSGGVGSCPVLQQDPVNGFFGYKVGWTDTIYKREISLTQINANEVSILVTIEWSKGLTTRTFRVKENILNWQ